MNDLFAKMFELLFKGGNLGDDLFRENVYGTVGIIMLILAIALPCAFYFALDKARYAGFKTWFFFLLGNFLLDFLLTFFLARRAVAPIAEYPITQYLYLGFVVALYGLVLYFLLSLLLKRFTTSLSRSPF